VAAFLVGSKHVFLQMPSRVQRPKYNVAKSQGLWTLTLTLDNSLFSYAGDQSLTNSFFLPGTVAGDFLSISSTSRHSDCSSRTSTLNDSGRPGSKSGFTLDDRFIKSWIRPPHRRTLPSAIPGGCARPRRLRAPHLISPKRCPPNCALPPSGCCVIKLYGPIEARESYRPPDATASTCRCSDRDLLARTDRLRGRHREWPYGFVDDFRQTQFAGTGADSLNFSLISFSVAPSNTGVAK